MVPVWIATAIAQKVTPMQLAIWVAAIVAGFAIVIVLQTRRQGRLPTKEEMAAAVARYRSGAGVERAFGDLRYKASADFVESTVLGHPGMTVANAFVFSLENYPAPSLPPMPFAALREASEGTLTDSSIEIVSSELVQRPAARMVEVAGRKDADLLRFVAFYGPTDVYLLRFYFASAEIEQAMRPLIDAMLDSCHFAEESLGVRIDDDTMRSVPEIKDDQGRRFVILSPFPAADDAGRLLCKNCGTPFDTLTTAGAQEFYAAVVKRDVNLSVICRKCDCGSTFLESDVDAVPDLVHASP